MSSDKNKQDGKPDLLMNSTLDIGGMWFAPVALFAFLTAVIIVYSTADRLGF
jgi:hypothetical protein